MNLGLMGIALVVICVAAFAVGNTKSTMKERRLDETIGDYLFIIVVTGTILFLVLEANK